MVLDTSALLALLLDEPEAEAFRVALEDADTRLVSARPDGRAGNGASTHPTVTDDGRYVAYETLASDLLPGDSGDYADIARADLAGRRVKQVLVSRSRFSGHGNAASQRPVISDAGEFVLFDSLATNLKPSESVRDDANGVRDVFLWNAPTGNVSLESRDSTNGYLHQHSWGPATSSRGNYVPFVSNDLLADENLPGHALTALLDGRITIDAALTPAPEDQPPAFPMIYLRYLGQQ